MAIIKNITLDNGILVNYHRIVSVNNIINHESIIEIASYTDKSKRLEEKDKILSNQPMNVFINTEYISIPYTKNLDVDMAYEYLKTETKLKGGINDID